MSDTWDTALRSSGFYLPTVGTERLQHRPHTDLHAGMVSAASLSPPLPGRDKRCRVRQQGSQSAVAELVAKRVPQDAMTQTTPDVAPAAFSLHKRDAVEWLATLRDESVDLVITDPPYESLEKHRAIGTTTRLSHSKASSNDWFQIFPNARFPELFSELYRVLRKNRHFYLFCDAETMFVAKPAAEQQGFRFWKPLVWDKQRIGMGYHYRSRYEFILFFEKGKRKLNNLGQPDIIECPRIHKGYPTEKPAFVSEVLVQQSTEAGEMVIDPFFGSASVGEAALRHLRPFMGCDLSDHAIELARQRLLSLGQVSEALYHSRLQAQQSLI